MTERDEFKELVKESLLSIKNSSDKDKKITIEYFRKKATEAPSRATRNFCLRMVNFAVQSLKEKEVRISNFTSMDDL
ncbi:hypothetical protein CUN31_03415 [Enterococcus faecalis]|uniref:hypothetical protein n=1 Tax=Enterococcus faecalis TaxID=1351 RepID=UPI0001B2E778|nr:hypothetical protein [Enterococcus faecalis]EEU79973.1 predicted protein [Enterococcus faecalis Fly1]EGO7617901.1 hypothetical protein [Enterococcus faecalis]EGO7913055.1 hypothetical protein [Enterococcus faecalis]EHZ2968489.1 hypothetical protein [Enterococcus faecalis]EIB6795296.1 hypothetical protein [Enterococcus faecalis]